MGSAVNSLAGSALPQHTLADRVSGSGTPDGPPAVEVDIGTRLPVAFNGLRAVITALDAYAPAALAGVAEGRRPEWEWLFPGTFPQAPLLADLAGTPSERRLHAESEQVFRVLDTAAEAITAALLETGRPLLLRGAARSDVVTLRALPRIAERLALAAPAPGVRLTVADAALPDAAVDPGRASERARAVRARTLGALRDRLGARVMDAASHPAPHAADLPAGFAGSAAPAVEHRHLDLALRPAAADPPERTAAAALLAVRSCFFSANHEGAILAAEALPVLLDAHPDLDTDRVAAHFADLDPGDGTPAIGITADVAESAAHLRALAYRCLGVVRALTGDLDGAREEFATALGHAPDPVSQARVLLLRALLAVKRSGTLPAGIADIERGLAALAAVDTPVSAVEQAWLRNVRALAHVRAKEFPQAMAQEKQAVALIAKLHSADATHLKINLISNISVLQEMAGRHDTAARTWEQFVRISSGWGDSFFKHHAYRAAGLHYRAGRHEEALAGFTAAHDLARKLGDHLHQQIIGTEIGGLLLDLGRSDEAAGWYESAEAAATVLADPYAIALARAGRAAATGRPPGPDVAATAARSLMYAAEAAALTAALGEGGDAVAAALPRPRTKLNRPFQLVNLEQGKRT